MDKALDFAMKTAVWAVMIFCIGVVFGAAYRLFAMGFGFGSQI